MPTEHIVNPGTDRCVVCGMNRFNRKRIPTCGLPTDPPPAVPTTACPKCRGDGAYVRMDPDGPCGVPCMECDQTGKVPTPAAANLDGLSDPIDPIAMARLVDACRDHLSESGMMLLRRLCFQTERRLADARPVPSDEVLKAAKEELKLLAGETGGCWREYVDHRNVERMARFVLSLGRSGPEGGT